MACTIALGCVWLAGVQDHKRRQILIHAAQAVGDPGTHAGLAGDHAARLKKVIAGSWLMASVWSERRMVMSSTILPV